MATEEAREVLGVRLFAWVLGLLITIGMIIGGLFAGMQAIVLTFGIHWDHGWAVGGVFMAVVLNMINYTLPFRSKLRAQEIAVILAMIYAGGSFMGSIYPYELMFYPAFGARHLGTRLPDLVGLDRLMEIVPPFFAPTDQAAIENIRFGGYPTPYAAWMPWLSFWIPYSILYFFMCMFLCTIVRKQWIDIESLGFPYAQPVISMIQDVGMVDRAAVGSEVAAQKRRSKLILIGFVVSALISVPDFIHILNPTVPGLPWWSNYWVKWSMDLVPLYPGLAEALPGSALLITWGPWYIMALWALIPIEILFSSWVFFILFYILLPPFFITAGLIPYDPTWPGYTRWSQIGRAGTIHPVIWGDFGYFWLGILALAFQWKYIKGTLKGLFGKPDVSDAEEPVPYRVAWIGFIASLILLVGLITMAGGSALPTIGAVGLIFLYNLGQMRLKAESGIFVTNSNNAAWMSYYITGGEWPTTRTIGDWTAGQWVPWMVANHSQYHWGNGTGAAAALIIDAYKILHDAKSNLKQSFIAMSVAALLAIVLSAVIGLSLVYTYGATVMTALAYWYRGSLGGNFAGFDPQSTGLPGTPWLDLGISFVAVLALMLGRFYIPRFPLSPVGFCLGLGLRTIDGLGWMFLWAWILKFLILKIGGARLYRETGVPLLIGVFLGGAFMFFMNFVVALPLAGGGWFAWGPT
jgi:hypothetical protein